MQVLDTIMYVLYRTMQECDTIKKVLNKAMQVSDCNSYKIG